MGQILKSKYDFFVRLVQFVRERPCVIPVHSDDPLSLFTLPFVAIFLPAPKGWRKVRISADVGV